MAQPFKLVFDLALLFEQFVNKLFTGRFECCYCVFCHKLDSFFKRAMV